MRGAPLRRMRGVRRALCLPLLLAACAGLPARYDNRTTPAMAYRTYRGAVARAEYDREIECLSDDLRARLGVRSRADYKDFRAVLGQRHRAIRGIVRSRIDGEPETLPDGRVRLAVRIPILFLSLDGSVWMRPVPVLRLHFEGEERPVYDHLPGLELVSGPGGLGVRVPADLVEALEEQIRDGRLARFVAQIEWFLDEFAFGDETPSSVRADAAREQE